MQDALSQLMAAELIHGRGAPPDATYVFKHALVQDTAYASMLRSRRQRIHADVARALEERFDDQIDAAPAIVAHHYTEAGIAELAVRYWTTAAELALARSNHVEAERFIEAGLRLIPQLAEGERQTSEVSLLVTRVNAFLVLKGFTAPETVNALTEAKRLLDVGVGTDLERFSVLYILCLIHYNSSRLVSALALAREIVTAADKQTEKIYRIVGYRLLGTILATMGENIEALEKLEHAERYREPRRDKLLSYRFGIDPGLAVLFYKQFVLLFLGRLNEAACLRDQAQSELRNIHHALTVAQGNYLTLVLPEILLGDFKASEYHAAELITFCAEKKLGQFSGLSGVFYAFARAVRQVSKENVAELRGAIEAQRMSGGRILNSAIMSFLVEVLLAEGDITGAEAALEEGFDFVEQSGERLWLAELHRLDGQVALKRPVPNSRQAKSYFLRAIEIARSQEARLLELRPATDLARFWSETSSPNDPRALLEPILDAIEGGETAPYVRNARALLAELA